MLFGQVVLSAYQPENAFSMSTSVYATLHLSDASSSSTSCFVRLQAVLLQLHCLALAACVGTLSATHFHAPAQVA